MSSSRYNMPIHLLEAPEKRTDPAKTLERGKTMIRARHVGELIAKASSEIEDRGYRLRSVNVGPEEIVVYVHPGGPTTLEKRAPFSEKKIKG